MPSQQKPQSGSLPFGSRNAAIDRLFFAVFPDARAAGRIVAVAGALRAEMHLHGKPLRMDRVHVTLHHLGDHCGLPQALIASANEEAGLVVMQPFEVVFDSVASFAGRARNRPLVLRGDDAGQSSLIALQGTLGDGLARTGLGRYVERRFVPHVTLLYDDNKVAPRVVEPIKWTVREFALVHSLLGRTEHRILARWALR